MPALGGPGVATLGVPGLETLAGPGVATLGGPDEDSLEAPDVGVDVTVEVVCFVFGLEEVTGDNDAVLGGVKAAEFAGG